jgi:hypothetical protein
MRPSKDPKELEKMITVATSSQSFDQSLGIPKWFMLDSSLVLGKLVNCTKTTFHSDAGLEFSISLQCAIPPASSYVHLDCAQAVTPPTEEHGFYGASSVVAADGEVLLVRIVVPVKGKYGYNYPVEYFIYAPSQRTHPIECLPCMDDEWARWPGVLGIAHCGKFVMVVGFRKILVVDNTCKGARKELVQLGRFCSGAKKWDVEEIELPYDHDNGLEPFQWDAVFAFSYGNRMAFVDYKTGLMFCDIFSYSPKLQYVKFPVPVRKVNFSVEDNDQEEGVPIESYRNVGICEGKIKFVSVDSCCNKTTGPIIKTWTLCIPGMVWEKDSILDVKHLWATAFKASHLPLWVPRFPVVDAQDPDILHFVLLGPNYHDRVWIVTIDMKTATLKSYKNYRNAEQRDEYKGIFMYKPFLCSVLSKYIVGPSGNYKCACFIVFHVCRFFCMATFASFNDMSNSENPIGTWANLFVLYVSVRVIGVVYLSRILLETQFCWMHNQYHLSGRASRVL